MIDKDVKLVTANNGAGQIYVDLRKVEGPEKDKAYADVRVIDRTPIPMSASVELYSTEQARRFGLCKLQADQPIPTATLLQWATLNGARALGLPESSYTIAPGSPARWVLLGGIDPDTALLHPDISIQPFQP